jgi:type II secretory pathway pseudopilin PulG
MTAMKKVRKSTAGGFSMVEMIVSIGLFTTLMLIIVGSFLSVTDAARKARSTRIALDNVSSAVDYMAREIRLGSYFRCETDTVLDAGYLADPNGNPASCSYSSGGGNILAFERAGGSLTGFNHQLDQLVFWYEVDGNGVGRLRRSTASGANPEDLTAPEINITDFRFYVYGTDHAGVNPANADQPRITIVIRGVAGGNKAKTQVSFSLQTTLSARTPNIPPP